MANDLLSETAERFSIGQREIKFRVWDTNSNRMVDPYHFEHRPDSDTTYEAYDDWRAWEDGRGFPCVLLQYTGFRDKHGVEIYEGDILKVCNGSINAVPWMEKPYAVEFRGGCWHMSRFCWDEEGNSRMDSTHWCEVIGNIFQHPHLLGEVER